MRPTTCRALVLAAVAMFGASCAKPHVDQPPASTAPATQGPASAGASTGEELDWATVKPVAAPAQPCVRYAATGNYHVCLAADGFGCIHYGDVCDPGKGP